VRYRASQGDDRRMKSWLTIWKMFSCTSC
jgi:hypothetical protein